VEVGAITANTSTQVLDPSRQQQLLGKDAFLQLLVTELSNQDPLNPMEDREYIAQLAQLSTLEQMTTMNSSMETLRLIQATSFVGKNVEAVALDGSRVTGVVTEVNFTDSEPVLIVNEMPVMLDNVIRVFAQQSEIQ
jgi:flagellar basal-body rod modification protein FlgD